MFLLFANQRPTTTNKYKKQCLVFIDLELLEILYEEYLELGSTVEFYYFIDLGELS